MTHESSSGFEEVKLSIRRRFRRMNLTKYIKEDLIIRGGYAATGILILVFSLVAVLAHNAPLAGAIGDYLSGVGQLIILIWILVTFWLQREDSLSQKDEQDRFDRSNQQINIIYIYESHIKRLDDLCREYIIKYPEFSDRYTNNNVIESINKEHIYIKMMSRDTNIQDKLRLQYLSNTDSVITFVDRYIGRFEILRNTIIQVDISNHLYDALLFEAECSDLYFLLISLKKTY